MLHEHQLITYERYLGLMAIVVCRMSSVHAQHTPESSQSSIKTPTGLACKDLALPSHRHAVFCKTRSHVPFMKAAFKLPVQAGSSTDCGLSFAMSSGVSFKHLRSASLPHPGTKTILGQQVSMSIRLSL